MIALMESIPILFYSIHSTALNEKPCMKSVYADPQFYYSGAIYTKRGKKIRNGQKMCKYFKGATK